MAEIIAFKRHKKFKVPRSIRDELSEFFLTAALNAEDGRIADFAISLVNSDGERDEWHTSRILNPKLLLKSLDAVKRSVISTLDGE